MAKTKLDMKNEDKDCQSDDDMFISSQTSEKSVHFVSDGESQNEDDEYKVFNDPVHGHITMHPLLVKIIDTPQFQRLRNIKQLGAAYFVYPGASHNRFEHCIGTSYLAGKLVRMLQKKQENLKITDEDVLCVEMAGLCHDLGHGPYSHMFDGDFLPRVRPDNKWAHEKGSCMMIDHLIAVNDLLPQFRNYNLLKTDITFVKEMIAGPSASDDLSQKGAWRYDGRGEDKSFLYEIVSNERNKVDVDKWDYFARDCYHLGIRNGFDHNRFMQFTKVLQVEGERLQICARDKESHNLYEMFHTRSILHRRAYQHRVVIAIDYMICDAMVLAEPHIKFTGTDGKLCTMSQCIYDPVAYTQLNDNIFDKIVHSTESVLEPARKILERVLKRELYKNIGATRPNKKISKEKVCSEIAAYDKTALLKPEDLRFNTASFSFGMKDKNPIDNFRFFSKSHPKKPYQIRRQDVSTMLSGIFEESQIQIFCVSPESSKIQAARDCFKLWSRANGSTQQDMGVLTPMKRKHSDEVSVDSKKTLKL